MNECGDDDDNPFDESLYNGYYCFALQRDKAKYRRMCIIKGLLYRTFKQ